MKAIQDLLYECGSLLVICVLLTILAIALRIADATHVAATRDIDAEDQVETTCEQTQAVQYVRYIQDVQNELPTYREE